MAQIHGKYILIKVKKKVSKKDQEVPQKPQKTKGKKDDSEGISNQRYYENALTTKKADINRELGKMNGLNYL